MDITITIIISTNINTTDGTTSSNTGTTGKGLVEFKIDGIWSNKYILFDSAVKGSSHTETFKLGQIPSHMKLSCSNNDGYKISSLKVNEHLITENLGWIDTDGVTKTREYDISTITVPIINNNHILSLKMRTDTEYYFNRALFDTFHLLIGIIIPLIFIYKLYKTRKNN
jgi:hypothetical protein